MDAVTYPDAAVQEMLQAHFVPIKLQMQQHGDHIRQFTPLWTPTLIVQDGRGREMHRETGFLPPEDFLPMLALGYAKGMFATGHGQEGLRALDAAINRHGDGEFTPQLLYWRACLGYQTNHDRGELNTWWGRLHRQFPDSTWTVRCSFFTPSQPAEQPAQVAAESHQPHR